MDNKKLLIVESPAKAKTIGKYLGPSFTVKSSVGHIRDLPKRNLAITIKPSGKTPDDGWVFMPDYEIPEDKKKTVAELRKAAAEASEIYLAPDPDREGEAIAWHLGEVLKTQTKGKSVHRVSYNEITKSAVLDAIAHPREIDMARVDAQQARRVVDRIVGYKISPLLWKYLNYGYTLSAGRVQSVALRLLVEREREIEAFKPEEYWLLGVEARKAQEPAFTARLSRLDGEKPSIGKSGLADMLIDDLDASMLEVSEVKTAQRARRPLPPFTTSTLQQTASSFCGFSPHRTMSLAQKLYENGLITYMRTDSVNISEQARAAAAEFIRSGYGAAYLPPSPNIYKSKAGAQQAHEAIRPTDVNVVPGSVKLDAAQAKLYDLVWRRFVSSQMAEAKLEIRSVSLVPDKPGLRHEYVFTASATTVAFDGFMKVSKMALPGKQKGGEGEDADSDEVASLPELARGDRLSPVRWLSERKETKPPPHYSEAALVKALEENGVGRPSTYAQTIETLVLRQYAKREARQLIPVQRGIDVNDWLVRKLPDLFDVGYTAKMEEELDKVEEGKERGDAMLSGFLRNFNAWMDSAKDPPPPKEKFDAAFSMLDEVKTWRPPAETGRGRKFDEREFVEDMRRTVASGSRQLSERQLAALVKIALLHRDEIKDVEARVIALGYGSELERAKNAPSPELVKWCFLTIDRISGLGKNPFLMSLREQVDRGRMLTSKQFYILARSIGENAGALDDGDAVRARLAPYVPEGFESEPADPAVPGLLALLEKVHTWKEPVYRGRKVYDDCEFYKSLKEQYARRSSLSPRQVVALRRVCVNYRDQIPEYEEKKVELGLDKVPVIQPRQKAKPKAAAEGEAPKRAPRRKPPKRKGLIYGAARQK